jgi:hypothetical protein
MYFRFVSEAELDQVNAGQTITSPQFGFVHVLPYHIENSDDLPLTIKDAMSFMIGTISQDYLLLLKDIEPFEIGNGPYANYLTVDENGCFEDIIFSEIHIHHYSKENIHAVFTGDFFAWENISRLKEL